LQSIKTEQKCSFEAAKKEFKDGQGWQKPKHIKNH
jgi:hypothetical protein